MSSSYFCNEKISSAKVDLHYILFICIREDATDFIIVALQVEI